MGQSWGKNIEEVAKTAGNKIGTAMNDRQKDVQLSLREIQMAVQVAKLRDDLKWKISFDSIVMPALVARALHSKNPAFIAPIIPLSFGTAYMYDGAYGGKLHRIKAGAEDILRKERDLFILPEGNRLMPTETYKASFVDSNIGR